MIPNFEDVRSWLDEVGLDRRHHKWVAWAIMLIALFLLINWTEKTLSQRISGPNSHTTPSVEGQKSSGSSSPNIGNVKGDVIFNIKNEQLKVDTNTDTYQQSRAKKVSPSASKINYGNLPLNACAKFKQITSSYNFEDGTHQLEAWKLFEKALSEIEGEEKKSIDMSLIKEARYDWQKGQSQNALWKFSTALTCNSGQ
jgi:hypothetical protein